MFFLIALNHFKNQIAVTKQKRYYASNVKYLRGVCAEASIISVMNFKCVFLWQCGMYCCLSFACVCGKAFHSFN